MADTSSPVRADPVAERIASVRREFARRYGRDAVLAAVAPGRVNVIGEHVDYNGGWVLPAAIDRHLIMAVAPREDRRIVLASGDSPEGGEFSLDRLAPVGGDRSWGRYVRGVLAGLVKEGHALRGMDVMVKSTIPVGGGLSSSAALEAATGLAVLELIDATMNRFALAKLCQAAEHVYAGVPCGIMDQAAVLCCEAGHLLLLDCEDETFVQTPFEAPGWSLLIINSGVAHELAGGEYAQRRAACEVAARRLGVTTLRHLDHDEFEVAMSLSQLSADLRRCVRHVVTENDRTRRTVAALRDADIAEAGRQLNAGHASLRDDYRVSCAELDFIAAAAQAEPAVAGCRMTGGGFGGSCVALVRRDAAEVVAGRVESAFRERFGHRPTNFVTDAAAGARVVRF